MKITSSIGLIFIVYSFTFGQNEYEGGYLNLKSTAEMRVVLNDSIILNAPVDSVLLNPGSYSIKAKVINDRNWFSLPVTNTVQIQSGKTTAIFLEPKYRRLLQSFPSEAIIYTAEDSLLGETPYIFNQETLFSYLYLEKVGFLRTQIDISGGQWPKMVRLQEDKNPESRIIIPTQPPRKSGFRKYSKPILAATSITSNWLSFYLKRKADDYYDKYKASSNSSKISKYYDRTEQCDLYASVMLGVSTAATAAFFYYLIKE